MCPFYGDQSTISWYVYDGLGSKIAEVNSAGVITSANVKTDVYGSVIDSAGSGSDHNFCGGLGHVSEDETGLIYIRARWYDPAIGRFISEDPAKDGVNWYSYCAGNPVNAIDPDGRFTLFEILFEDVGEQSAQLKAYMLANGVKNHIQRKLLDVVVNWSVRLDILCAEACGYATTAGYTIEVGIYRVMFHLAGHAGEAPHVSVWNNQTGQYVQIPEEVMYKFLSQL